MKIKNLFFILLILLMTLAIISCSSNPDLPNDKPDDNQIENPDKPADDLKDPVETFGDWISNGDGTHSRTSNLDQNKKETEKCGGGKGACTGTYTCSTCGGSYIDHTFIQRAKSEYLVTKATCTESAVYRLSCACGATNDKTFISGNPNGHDYVYTYNGNGTHISDCQKCDNYKEADICKGGNATEEKGAICSLCNGEYTSPKKVIRVLAIGNSYSVDSMEYLYGMLEAAGYDEIHLGNLYIGGCSLSTHASNAQNDKADYTYYLNETGSWRQISGYKISDAIKSQAWDYVTLQQNSSNSGKSSTFNPYLNDLLTYLGDKLPAKTKILWHMTWAYSPDGSLGSYGNNQMQMYNEIVTAVSSTILTENRIDGVIPVGTAIQNVRTSSIGENVCRDTNCHLNLTIGRYTAALTWCAYISGCDIDSLNCPQISGVTEDMVKIAKESVKNAINKPLAITQSKFTSPIDSSDSAIAKSKGYDITNGYVLYNWNSNANSYWNSTASATMIKETTPGGAQYGKFVCSDKISVETLPADTIFILDFGWQLRIEKYNNAQEKYNGSRPGNNGSAVQVLTQEFLSDAKYVSFNLSHVDGTQITDFEEAATHVRIYVKVAN